MGVHKKSIWSHHTTLTQSSSKPRINAQVFKLDVPTRTSWQLEQWLNIALTVQKKTAFDVGRLPPPPHPTRVAIEMLSFNQKTNNTETPTTVRTPNLATST